ncbi:lipase [Plakobranchus ocellatus]|uniref:Lipase n=1 Tax=Plakobranchus ocellatus TaxID=259542 RepID=A0AAV3YC19_9GAST|nr:lipase [Plakobranchus ocellatus]
MRIFKRAICFVVVIILGSSTALQFHSALKKFLSPFENVNEISPYLDGLNSVISYFAGNARQNIFSFEPDFYRSVCQLVTSKGYPCEEHWVTTEDGFILGLQRIPHGVAGKARASHDRPVALLQHGLVEASFSFVANQANESLAFLLADAGADVWLGNMRGNVYSENHTSLDPAGADFWDWSFEEMARYDLPAMVHFVCQQTGQSQLFYVGHSQGAGTGFLQLSRDPGLSQIIRHHFALAPAVKVTVTGDFGKTISDMSDYLYFLLYVFQHGPTTHVVPNLPPVLCRVIGEEHCIEFLFSLTGTNYASFNLTRLPVYLHNFPQPTSLNNLLHWFQLVKAEKFQNFDEGSPADNLKRYGQESPPEYDLSQYDVPTTIFYGGHDNFIGVSDILWLRDQVKQTKLVFIPQYEHQDFVWGTDAATYIYSHIVDAVCQR